MVAIPDPLPWTLSVRDCFIRGAMTGRRFADLRASARSMWFLTYQLQAVYHNCVISPLERNMLAPSDSSDPLVDISNVRL